MVLDNRRLDTPLPPYKKNIICGIYALHNLIENRSYIGSSTNIYSRMTHHKWRLRKLGTLKTWELRILEICVASQLIERERYWIKSTPNCYNKAKNADSGWNQSNAWKKFMSVLQTEIGSDPEERKRRSNRAKAQHKAGNLGHQTWKTEILYLPPISLEVCNKLRDEYVSTGIATKPLSDKHKLSYTVTRKALTGRYYDLQSVIRS